MAKRGKSFRFQGRLLGPLEKRDLINADEADPEVLRAYGKLYLEAERYADALDFFLGAGDGDGLAKVKARAIEAADNFLLHRIEGSGLLAVTQDDWQALANSADRLGKPSVTEIARSRARGPTAGSPANHAEEA